MPPLLKKVAFFLVAILGIGFVFLYLDVHFLHIVPHEPKLSVQDGVVKLAYDASGHESEFDVSASVIITAGNSDLFITDGVWEGKAHPFDGLWLGINLVNGTTSLPKEGTGQSHFEIQSLSEGSARSTAGGYLLSAGKTQRFLAQTKFNPAQMFSGSYTARINSTFYPHGTTLSGRVITPTFADPIVVVGERSPFIAAVNGTQITSIDQIIDVKKGDPIVFSGARFSSTTKMMYGGHLDHPLTPFLPLVHKVSPDGTTFTLSPFQGWDQLYPDRDLMDVLLVNENGESNIVTLRAQ